MARQVEKGSRVMQMKAHTKSSGEGSPTHKALDAVTIGSSDVGDNFAASGTSRLRFCGRSNLDVCQ